MALTVDHLNADSTFLFTFTASPHHTSTFTILVDPWLNGDSIVNRQLSWGTRHNIPASITNLEDIPEPDLVIISQNQPDHCHEQTLRQLSPRRKTIIAAEPKAAKAIRKWQHFISSRVIAMQKYDPINPACILRFWLPPLETGGEAGEVTVAYIPQKNDRAGLHNGFGITYQPPTFSKTRIPMKLQLSTESFMTSVFGALRSSVSTTSSIYSSDTEIAEPPSLELDRGASGTTAEYNYQDIYQYDLETISDIKDQPFVATDTSFLSGLEIPQDSFMTEVMTAFESATTKVPKNDIPKVSQATKSSGQFQPSTSTPPPRPISIFYSPHGIPAHEVLPYINSHLIPISAFPTTLLLHSFSSLSLPWYFGGQILYGAKNGILLARTLMAQTWLGAHDEEKENIGYWVTKLKNEQHAVEEVRKMLCALERCESMTTSNCACSDDGKDDSDEKGSLGTCQVRDLGVGESMVITI